MPRARTIKYGFFRNELLAEVSVAARLLFIGLWTLVDRAGRVLDNPKRIKMQLMPCDAVDCNDLLIELAERGFVRGLLPAERGAWSSREHPLNCLNCGAPTRGDSERCRFCDSPLVVVDVPRLLHGLRHATEQEPTPRPDGQPFAWPCVACGAAMDPNRDAACGACGQPAPRRRAAPRGESSR